MVRVKVTPPLAKVFGIGKAFTTVSLELPFEEGASLRTIFRKLAVQHPAFEPHANPKTVNPRPLLTIIDGKVVLERNHSKVPIRDEAEISLMLPVSGG